MGHVPEFSLYVLALVKHADDGNSRLIVGVKDHMHADMNTSDVVWIL